MNTVYLDSRMAERDRRERAYQGQLFVFSPRPTTEALCAFARQLTEEAFAPLEPRTAQYELTVEAYTAVLAELKPRFIHHPKSKELLRAMLTDLGCDPGETYFDVPRMRIATAQSYLTSGLAYVLHPHRDTWYSAPMCQLNWWLPMYEIESENSMAFHPRYWNEAVKNGSSSYNYYEWNASSRKNAAQHIRTDTRIQPKPEEPMQLDPQVRVVCPPGGVIMFSAQHMHSTVPNTSQVTRFSVDFRTVNVADVAALTGAPNLDSAPTGTALRDFMRVSDLARIPEDLIAPYDDDEAKTRGVLVFEPPAV